MEFRINKVKKEKKNKDPYCPLIGKGHYSGNGMIITDDGSTVIENGKEKKLNHKETRAFLNKLFGTTK